MFVIYPSDESDGKGYLDTYRVIILNLKPEKHSLFSMFDPFAHDNRSKREYDYF